MKPVLSVLPTLLFSSLVLAGSWSHAQDAELRGTVTDGASGATLVDVAVTLTPTGGGPVIATTTGFFGKYVFTVIPPGEYTLRASAPGYSVFTELRTFVDDELANKDIALSKLITGSELIDLYVSVSETSTGIPIDGVPVRIRQYSLLDSSVLENTTVLFTDSVGEVDLLAQPKAFYDFRINDPVDTALPGGAANPIFDPLSSGGKIRMEKSHHVNAQLLSIRKAVTITVMGPDPADPDAGAKPLADTIVEIAGIDPKWTPPGDFDPLADDATDLTPLLFQRKQATTDKEGKVTFKDLPPIQFQVRGKKLGYDSPLTFFGPDPGSGMLPMTHPHPIDLNADTKLEVFLDMPDYLDLVSVPGLVVGVKLEGMAGPIGAQGEELKTSTSGITRFEPAMPFFSPEFPMGVFRAEFSAIAPGNYTLSVDENLVTADLPAFEDAVARLGIQFRGSMKVDVAFGMMTGTLLELKPVPATIRGRFYKAEKRSTLDLAGAKRPHPLDRWDGPAYVPAEQAGIEFTESVLSEVLAPGLEIVAVDTDPDGTFALTIIPGYYGIKIPPLDGYWGSNYRMRNHATGEEFELGWPYATDFPTIPAHPFGSFGIAVSSGDELELDLYVRKQTYFLDGTVVADEDSPALDQVLFVHADGTPLLSDHSHLAITGRYTYDEHVGVGPPPVTKSLTRGFSRAPGGAKTLNAGAEFLVEAPPGTHKLSVEDDHHVFTTGTFDIVPLPDYGFVGEGIPGAGIIPMENNWSQLDTAVGVIDPWVSDYTGTHSLLIRFVNGDGMEVTSRNYPDYFKHPGLGDKLFRAGLFPHFTMTAGAYTIWIKEAGSWYSDTFTIPDIPGPATKVVTFTHGVPNATQPQAAYDLVVNAVNASDRSQKIGGLTITMDDDTEIVLGADGTSTIPSHTGTYIPKSFAGSSKWKLANGSMAASYSEVFEAGGARPKVTVTVLFTRGVQIRGTITGTAEIKAAGMTESFKGSMGAGLKVLINNRLGTNLKTLTTDADGNFTTGLAPLDFAEVLYVEVNERGYLPFRTRLTPSMGVEVGGMEELDFVLTIDLTPFKKPIVTIEEETFGFRGMFLVGVTNGTNLSALVTRYGEDFDRLMPYKAQVKKVSLEWVDDFPGYDKEDGSLRPKEDLYLRDKVARIWIVDLRGYPGPYNVAEPIDLSDPASHFLSMPSERILDGPDAGKPDPLFHRKMRAWIDKINGTTPLPEGVEPLQFFQKTQKFTGFAEEPPGPSTGPEDLQRYFFEDELDVALLPPGLFQPYIIAETENGAFSFNQWSVAKVESGPGYREHRELFGVQVPPNLAKLVVDAAGTLLQFDLTGGSVTGPALAFSEKFFPSKWIKLDGDVDGDIEVNEDKTLHYRYTVGVELSEGDEVPSGPGSWLGIGPKYMGGIARGSLTFDANGSRSDLPKSLDGYGIPALGFTTRATGGTKFGTSPKVSNLLPRAKALKVTPFAEIELVGESTKPLAFAINGELKPLHTQFLRSVNVSGGVTAEVDFARLIPQLRGLKAATKVLGGDTKLTTSLTVKPGIKRTTCHTTRSPAELFNPPVKFVDTGGGSVIPVMKEASVEAKKPRGTENRDPKPLAPELTLLSAEPCPNKGLPQWFFTMGLEGKLEASVGVKLGEVGLTGDIFTENFRDDGIKAWDYALNQHGDAPYFTSAKGYVTIDLTARARAFFVEGRKKFKLAKFLVDKPFNTSPVFSVTPIEMSESSITLGTAPRVVFAGMEPHLVPDAFPIAQYAVGGSSGEQVLACLDPDSSTGTMKLQVAVKTSPSTWAAPVEVASAAGIVGVAVHPLSGGGWMATWSEVEAADLSASSPPTTIKYATTADGVSWTTPATIGSTLGTAMDLDLIPMPGGDLGLVYLETERGPGSTIIDLEAFLFSGGSWGTQQVLFDDLFLSAFGAAGPGFAGTGPAQIMGITDVGGLVVVEWDGATLSAPIGLDGATTGTMARISSGAPDSFMVAYEKPDGILGLVEKTGHGAWTPSPSLDIGTQPADLAIAAVTDGLATHYLTAWVSGDAQRDVSFAYLDETGALLSGPTPISPGSPGIYGDLQISPVPGALAGDVLALYRDDLEVSELRSFATTEALGLPPLDRETDLMLDLAELQIVDADPTDLLNKIDDVLPGDDFDGDGYSNKVELDAGTDPTDPDSFPGQKFSVAALIDTTEELGTGPAVFSITRTGDPSAAVTVHYSMTGTAIDGTDYTAVAGMVEFAAGASTEFIDITPIKDALAEGSETVVLTIDSDPAYSIGANSPMVTILDSPLDAWRFDQFTMADLADPAISGFLADGDHDSLDVLEEFAFGSLPKLNDVSKVPELVIVENTITGERFLGLEYEFARIDDPELLYHIELTEDLKAWRRATDAEVVQVSVTDNGDGTETVVVRDRAAVGPLRGRFMRVAVERFAGAP